MSPRRLRHHVPWLALVLSALLLAGCAVLGNTGGVSLASLGALVALVLAGCGIPEVVSEVAKNPFDVPAPAKSVDVANLGAGDGSLGFVVVGQPGSRLGNAVSVGDLNGDNIADIAIGAPHTYYYQLYDGVAYVVFGGVPHGATVAAATAGFPIVTTLVGRFTNDFAGTAVAFIGDVNGDLMDDLAIGSPRLYPNTGSVAVLFGTTTPPAYAILDGALLNGIYAGYVIGQYVNANYGQGIGTTIAAAGDLNGDGFKDMLIGAPRYDRGGGVYQYGKVYETFLGITAITTPSYVLSPAAPNRTTILYGAPLQDSQLGGVLAGDGNVDGDGSNLPDVVMGAPYTTNTYDHVFVHFNPGADQGRNCSVTAPVLGPSMFGFRELNTGDGTGSSVAMGDLDGDGLADVIIGSPGAHRNLVGYTYGDIYTGRVHVIFGSPALPGTSMVETALNGSNGFSLIGASEYEYLGVTVAVVGDVNGDGLKDLAIIARDVVNTSPSHDIVYIIFGGPRPGVSEIHLSQLTAAQGLIIRGIEGYGGVIAGGKDVNGDGLLDIVIGSRYAGGTGQVFVLHNQALQ